MLCLHLILPCTGMKRRSQMPFHCENQHSCSSRLKGWSAAAWRRTGFPWAPHRLPSQKPHLVWCCSAAPQTAAWTGWPEAVASVASHWTSGEREVCLLPHRLCVCTYVGMGVGVCVCVRVCDWRGVHPLLISSTAEQSSLCLTAWRFSMANILTSVWLSLSISTLSMPHFPSDWFPCCVCGKSCPSHNKQKQTTSICLFVHVFILCVSLLTTTPNCSDSAKSSYSSFISARTLSCSDAGNCFTRFYMAMKEKIDQ